MELPWARSLVGRRSLLAGGRKPFAQPQPRAGGADEVERGGPVFASSLEENKESEKKHGIGEASSEALEHWVAAVEYVMIAHIHTCGRV